MIAAAPAGDVAAWLATLRDATSVELGPVGAFAMHTDRSTAFAALASDPARLAAHRAELEALCRGPAPAPRVYGAVLLRGIDREAGTRALEALLGSTEQVTYISGCTIATYPLGVVARFLLVPPAPPPAPAPRPPRRLFAASVLIAYTAAVGLGLAWLLLR